MARNTKKSRDILKIIDVLTEQLFDVTPNESPSINGLAQDLTNNALRPDADADIRSMNLTVYTNMVQRYFAECCKIIGKDYDLDYHPVTKKYYIDGEPTPTTTEQATDYLALFGKGKNKKTHGARFVLPHMTTPDTMHSTYIKLRAANSDDIRHGIAERADQAEHRGVIKINDLTRQRLA